MSDPKRRHYSPLAAGMVLATACVGLAFVAQHHAGGRSPAPRTRTIRELLQTTPLAFERNEGQTAKQVQYLARGSGYTLFLTRDEAVLSLPAAPMKTPPGTGRRPAPKGAQSQAVRLKLVGANRQAKVEPVEKLPVRTSYYLGNDTSRWKENVPTFARVRYHEVYDGIDLVYHGSQGVLEYDFEVQPGRDPAEIRLSIEGADRLELNADGDLMLHTSAGVVRQPRPTLYQESGGKRHEVDGGYLRLASGDIGFRVGPYNQEQTLVIDPVINYSTMIGGTGGEEAFTFCDTPRGMLVGGYTGSANFPVTGLPGEDTALNGSTDAFLYQFNADTNGPGALISATYLGGSGDDQIRSAVATNPTVYVTGETFSSNFPVSSGFGPAYAGNGDAFVAVLRLAGTYAQDLGPQGIQLQAARFLGGSGTDTGKGIVHTSSGLVVVGSTSSTNFPTQGTGAFAWQGGATDGFVTSLPITVNGLTVSTHLGGTGDDSANGVAADPDGRIYVTGGTSSTNFPTAGDPHFSQNQGGTDAFLTRFDPLLVGVSIPSSTYIGGGSSDIGYGVAADVYGQSYVTGETHSSNFPASTTLLGSAQTSPAGFGDAFVCRANTAGRLEYSTYLGGGSSDAGYAVGLRDRLGQVVVGGVSGWGGLPATYDGQGAGTSGNGFVSIVDTFFPGANSVSATGYLSGAAVYDVAAYGLHDSRVAAVGTTAWGIPHVDGPQAYAGGSDGFFANMNLLWGPSSWGLGVAAYETPYVDPATVTLNLTRPDTNTTITVWRRAGAGSFQPLNLLPYPDPMDPLQMSAIDAGVAQGTTYTYVAHGNATGQVSYPFTMTTSLKAPSNLTASAVSENQIQLAWTNNAYNHTQFRIERRYGTVGSFSTVTFVPAGTHSYLDTVVNGSSATYYYRVYACNDVIESPASNVADATVQIVPAAPTGLSATVISPTQVNLTWTDNATNETGYRIDRSLYSNFAGLSGTIVHTPNLTSYSATNLAPNTLYYFRVRSERSGVESPASNTATATTPSGLPAAPDTLTATAVSTSQINLTWADRSNNETGFKIERSSDNFVANIVLVTTTGANATSYNNPGLASSTQYHYRVRATNTYGDSGNSNTASATTFLGPPPQPTGLTATAAASGREINLSWNAIPSATSLLVERARANHFLTELVQTTLNGTNITAFSTGSVLVPNTTYYFRVRATNSAGTSDFSTTANTTTPQVLPAAPSDLTATVSAIGIDLTWTDNSDNESGFRLERSLSSNFTSPTLTEYTSQVTSGGSYGLTANTTYYFRVRAYNSAGESANSTTSATTLPNPPAMPLNFAAAVVSQSQINLSWNDNSNNEDGFRVERSTSTNYSGAAIFSVSANQTTYADTGLAPNTAYYYRIRAYNTGGNSAYAGTIIATTGAYTPAAPTNLAGTAISQTQINLTWTDNSDNETGFEILWASSGSPTYILLTTVGAGVTTYSATGLANNQSYSFRVRATNTYGTSNHAACGPIWLLPYPPIAPSGLQAAGATGQITLIWTDNSADEDSFEIQGSNDNLTYTTLAFIGADLETYVETGLPVSTLRYYRVRAWNAGGSSVFTNTATASTAPAAPSNLLATVFSNSRIDLTWTDNSSNETGFKIERSNDNFVSNIVLVTTTAANAVAYSNTGLNNGVTFYYRVRAVAGSVESDNSNVAITRTSAPAAPSNLAATAVSSSQINLTWNDNSNNESEFRVLRSTNGSDYSLFDTLPRNATSYSATGLLANKRYWFKIRAVNGAGNNTSGADNTWTLP